MQKKLNSFLFSIVMLDFAFGGWRGRNSSTYFVGRSIGKLENLGLFDFNVNGISFDAKAVNNIEMIGNIPKIVIKAKL